MDIVYSVLDTLLPFEWAGQMFMKNALLAVLLVTPLFGLLSTMVVSNRMAFFSDSLGHGAFTGIAIGALAGLVSPLVSLIIFSVVFALLITWISNRAKASTDTIIGVFSSMAIALGLMLMTHGGSFNKYSAYLVGDILSVTPDELLGLLVVGGFVVLAWGLLFNRLLILSINASFARSRGISVMLTEGLFASLLAVVVSISIQWVGILIINALLVLPAAAARNVANSVKEYHVVSVGISLLSGITGLILAYELGMAAGATIVVVASVLFFLTLAMSSWRRR